MSGKGYISDESEQICELCGKLAECRPYGPHDEQICFDCGMKNEEITKRKFLKKVCGLESA